MTRTTWKRPLWKSAALLGLFLSFDIPFLAANLFKFLEGGYVPILAGGIVFVLMITWKTGRRIYLERAAIVCPPFETFLAELGDKFAARILARRYFFHCPVPQCRSCSSIMWRAFACCPRSWCS